MIVFVGNEIKLGGLVEVARNRLSKEVVFAGEDFNIRRQENDILLKSEGASFIVYDTECYLNDAEEIIEIIKRIKRATKAKPVLLVPTSNPKNEIIKNAVESQIKAFVNTSLSMGEQKDQFEKTLLGFYEANEDVLVSEAEKVVAEETSEIKSFVVDLYDAKQREEERENTVIINQKGAAEIIIGSAARIFTTLISVIVFILAAIGLSTLIYPEIRSAFMTELNHVIEALQKII